MQWEKASHWSMKMLVWIIFTFGKYTFITYTWARKSKKKVNKKHRLNKTTPLQYRYNICKIKQFVNIKTDQFRVTIITAPLVNLTECTETSQGFSNLMTNKIVKKKKKIPFCKLQYDAQLMGSQPQETRALVPQVKVDGNEFLSKNICQNNDAPIYILAI